MALSHSASFDHRRLPEAWRAAMAIFAAVAYREGWEEVLFLLMFLAIWRLATIEPAGDFQPPLSADLVGQGACGVCVVREEKAVWQPS